MIFHSNFLCHRALQGALAPSHDGEGDTGDKHGHADYRHKSVRGAHEIGRG